MSALNPHHNRPQIYIPFLSFSCLSFIAGIVLANYVKINFIIFYAATLFSLAVSFYLNTKKKKCGYLIIFVFFLIGMLRQANLNVINSDDISHLSKFKVNKIKLEGLVVSALEEGKFGRSFVFSAKNIKVNNLKSRVSGKVLVRLNKRLNINYGDTLVIEGKLTSVKDESNFNRGLIRKGIRAVLSVSRKDWIDIKRRCGFSVRRLAIDTKENLKKRFKNISPPAGDFLIAFILGDREGLDEDVYNAFKQTGTVHVLAISGLHISVIIFMLILVLKVLRLKIKIRFVVTILFLLFYGFMTGLRPSIIRAVVMGIVFLFSFLVRREYHIYNSLALSAMIILFIWPWQVFDIGFQLSYISVLSIVFMSPKILSLLPKPKNRFLYFVIGSLVISFSTWLVTTPLVAYYFGIISAISVIANLFVIPFTPFILGGGFLYLLASWGIPFLSKWLALSLEFIIDVLISITLIFRSIPFAYFYIEKFNLWILVLYYFLIILLFNGFAYAAQRK